MSDDEPPTDAMAFDSEDLLRRWFHWWRTSNEVPLHPPDNLHVATAAYLAARKVERGRKIYGPADL